MSKGGLLCQRSRGWKGSTIHLATQTTAMVDTVLEGGSSMQMTITDSISATAVCFLSSIPMVIMRFHFSPALRPCQRSLPQSLFVNRYSQISQLCAGQGT